MFQRIAAVLLWLAATSHAVAEERNVFYIVDASGSMWGRIDGALKIDVARALLLDRVPSWRAHGVRVGLAAFGHRRKGDCGDIEVLVPLQELDEARLRAAAEGLTPRGKTPLAGSIALVAEALRTREEISHVVLISDGEETCDADPCEAVRELRRLGIGFTLDVIGFDITEEERAQLQCIAEAGGGRYFTASNAAELETAMAIAEETEPVEKVAQNIQIVLDGSERMRAGFGSGTKLGTAVALLREKMSQPAAETENLALRVFGGVCESPDSTRLVVPFGTGNGGAVAERAAGIAPGGASTLASALGAALDDFGDPRRFEDVARRVVVFTGGLGHCDPRLLVEVNRRYLEADIQPEFHLIAMDPPPDQVEKLKRTAGAVGAYLHPVSNEAELRRAMDRIFDLLPVLSGVRTITEMLNAAIQHVNGSIRLIQSEDYDAAEKEVAAGRALIGETRPQFEDLGRRGTRARFVELYELAARNRALQEEILAITVDMKEAHRAKDVEAWNALGPGRNDAIGTYNANVGRMNGILKSLR